MIRAIDLNSIFQEIEESGSQTNDFFASNCKLQRTKRGNRLTFKTER